MIKLANVSKYYYSANSVVPALRKINLEFDIGEFVAITGESGSGKSTLLNIISGMDTYDDGELYINGEETSYYDDADWEEYRKNKIGFVYQDYNLIESNSALYNVTSVLLIQGYSELQAKKIAKEMLHRVGLGKLIHHKAANLSSGQKQRLSIARALAKNTDIIVADEPTGNLDSETGKQIMELFGEIAKEKLMIIVTHNFEEAAPYITRKIRIYDGDVVSDEQVVPESAATKEQSDLGDTIDKQHKEEIKERSDRSIAWNFARMNVTTQPLRVLLFMMFLLVTAAVSFIFLGDIYSNWDDTPTKIYDDSAFYNGDNSRIVVQRKDNGALTDADMQKISQISYVKSTDQFGYSNDFNYYIEKGKDYNYIYSSTNKNNKKADGKAVYFTDSSHFVKSITCIQKEDLKYGKLPTKLNEVVIYSDDKNDLGKEKLCYFTSENCWKGSQYFSRKVKIVGILKKDTNQVYFSKKLCNMLSYAMYGDHYNVKMCYDLFKSDYTENLSFIPVIGDIKDGQTPILRVSEDLIIANGKSPQGQAKLLLFRGGKDGDDKEDYTNDVYVDSKYNHLSSKLLLMSEAQFDQLFRHQSPQASLFISDYIHTDSVLKELNKMGYIAFSSYRVGSVEYDKQKVAERAGIMVKAFLVLIMCAILEFIIIRSLFQIKKKDYIILKSIGMNHSIIKKMNLYEMLLYSVISVVVIPIVMKILSITSFDFLVTIMKYYNIFTYLIYIILNIFMITVTVKSFNKYLKRKQKWS